MLGRERSAKQWVRGKQSEEQGGHVHPVKNDGGQSMWDRGSGRIQDAFGELESTGLVPDLQRQERSALHGLSCALSPQLLILHPTAEAARGHANPSLSS
jgi:hypothetical protein